MNKTSDEKKECLKELFPYPYGAANYLINVSNKHRYIYFETPKVACSTIKRTLQSFEVDNDVDKLAKDVHDKAKSPLLSPMSLANPISRHIKTHFTFGFVRNPYSRLLSCYLDKIAGSEYERNIRLPKIGLDPSDDISFSDFLRAVKTYPVGEWDIHWMPQTILLAHDKIDLDFIGRQETFAPDFNKVLAFLNKEERSTEIINTNWHSVGANKKLEQYLTKEARELISEIYYDDFKAYGYGFEPYFA